MTNVQPLTCPKCESQMLSTKWFGVRTFQCTGCAAVLVEQESLQQFVDGAARFGPSAHVDQAPPAQPYPPAPQPYPPAPPQQDYRGVMGGLFGGGGHGYRRRGHH